MAYQAGIVGGSGYTGAELLRLLAGHPDIDVVHVTADSNAGAAVAGLYPSLAAAYPGLEYAPYDAGRLRRARRRLPGAAPRRVAAHRAGARRRRRATSSTSVPTSASRHAVYEQWYGQAHGAPDLLDRFAFGLPELFGDDVRAADHVAAPGCYPTATALALAPLFAAGLVEPPGIVVDAMSGVSGAGRGLSAPEPASPRPTRT